MALEWTTPRMLHPSPLKLFPITVGHRGRFTADVLWGSNGFTHFTQYTYTLKRTTGCVLNCRESSCATWLTDRLKTRAPRHSSENIYWRVYWVWTLNFDTLQMDLSHSRMSCRVACILLRTEVMTPTHVTPQKSRTSWTTASIEVILFHFCFVYSVERTWCFSYDLETHVSHQFCFSKISFALRLKTDSATT